MATRVWYQSAVEFSKHPAYRAALLAHFERVKRDDTEVSLHGMDPRYGHGLPQEDIIGSPFTYNRTAVPLFVDAVVQAGRQGYDAFVIGTFSEPVLRELRSLSAIPVVSVAETTLLVGCTIAARVGMVTLSRLAVPYNEKSVSDHGLKHRVSGIHVVAEEMTERSLDEQFAHPGPYLDRFRAAAREAIAAGAGAIVPSEGVVAAICAANGLTEVDGAPVIDSIGTPVLYAEFAVQLKRRTGVQQSRRNFPRPTEAALAALVGG